MIDIIAGWSLTSILLYTFLLGSGICIGYMVQFLQSHTSRCHFESDERRKKFNDKIPIPDDIEYLCDWLPNSRGALLFRQQLIPIPIPISCGGVGLMRPRGVIGICHGFMDHSLGAHTDLAIRFCREGYAVVMLDNEGHGLSGKMRSDEMAWIDDEVEYCSAESSMV